MKHHPPTPPRHASRRRATLPIALGLLLAPALAAAGGGTQPAGDEAPGVVARIRARRLEWVAETDAWFQAGPVGAYVNLQDTRMTPLVYSGFGAGFSFSDEVVRERWLWPTAVTGRYAMPTGSPALAGTYQSISADVETAILYRIPETRLSAGGGVRGGAHARVYDKLSNSSANTDIVVSLNAGVDWRLPFTLAARPLEWSIGAATPVFSWVGRFPQYALYGLASYWAPPWRFARFTFETGLTWELRWSAENTARLAYTWDFYGMNEIDGLHVLRIATHTVSLTVGTKRM